MRDGCRNPGSPCRSVSLFSCISQFAWQPWKDPIQTTRTPNPVASDLCTTFHADTLDGERFLQALNDRFLRFTSQIVKHSRYLPYTRHAFKKCVSKPARSTHT